MMWMHDGGMGWGWGVFGAVWMVLFWGSIIAIVVWGINRLTKAGDSPRSQIPLDIAKTRYARGEISQEEFGQLKRDLG
jgi:putative membrane protein